MKIFYKKDYKIMEEKFSKMLKTNKYLISQLEALTASNYQLGKDNEYLLLQKNKYLEMYRDSSYQSRVKTRKIHQLEKKLGADESVKKGL